MKSKEEQLKILDKKINNIAQKVKDASELIANKDVILKNKDNEIKIKENEILKKRIAFDIERKNEAKTRIKSEEKLKNIQSKITIAKKCLKRIKNEKETLQETIGNLNEKELEKKENIFFMDRELSKKENKIMEKEIKNEKLKEKIEDIKVEIVNLKMLKKKKIAELEELNEKVEKGKEELKKELKKVSDTKKERFALVAMRKYLNEYQEHLKRKYEEAGLESDFIEYKNKYL